ncbi:MAG: NfeD family protein [Candidatus Berkiellales bacterium]
MREFFSHLVFWHWFALAMILAILDVVLGANFLFVWCGMAAAVVGIIVMFIPKLPWEYQFLIFGVGILASLVFWRRLNSKFKADIQHLNRRAEQYIGRTFTLDAPIVNGRGRVRVEDTIWRVEGQDLPLGTKVKVVAVDGIVLKVEKV